LVNGNPVTVNANLTYLLQDVDKDSKIDVTFSKKKYVVTVIADGGGNITPGNDVRIEIEQNQTFTFAAWDGFELQEVRLDGHLVDLVNNTYTITNIHSNHTLYAYFGSILPNTYTITANHTQGGTITPDNVVAIYRGLDQSYTITPEFGYDLADVLIDGVSIGNVNPEGMVYTFKNVTSSHTIRAVFALHNYRVEIVTNGNGSADPTGVQYLPYKTTKLIRFYPEDGYMLGGVTIDGIPVATYNNTLPLYVEANALIVAEFVTDVTKIDTTLINVMVIHNDGGSVDPTGKFTLPYGSTQIFNIVADDDYVIDKVLENGKDITPPPHSKTFSITLNNIIIDEVIEVTFAPETSIRETFTNMFNVSPNPSDGIIYLSYEGTEIEYIKVLDVTGSIVLELRDVNHSIDLSNLASGKYTLFIHHKRGIEAKQVMKIK
jgi:hypothetical protein